MATAAKFVSDFRSAVVSMIEAGERVQNLSNHFVAMGWRAEDFASQLPADITVEDFMAAVTACQNMQTQYAQLGAVLAKMRG